MRYSDAPRWAYSQDHPVYVRLTREQVDAAVKKIPSFKMPNVDDALRDYLGRRGRNQLTPDSWEYIRKKDGSKWLIVTTWFMKRCFEMPNTIANRFEALHELIKEW